MEYDIPAACEVDSQGRRIERIVEGSNQALERDILRMFALTRERARISGCNWRCYLSPGRILVCEMFPDAVRGCGNWFETPTFFQNDCGVTFLPRGLPIEEEPIKLYSSIFLPGQFVQFCSSLLRRDGWLTE